MTAPRVVRFQAEASVQGRAFEEAAVTRLRAEGWSIEDLHSRPDEGYPEIDIVAVDPTGVLWWVEVKGSWNNTPGLERGDTVKKALGVAADLRSLRDDYSQDGETPVPYMVIASHAPRRGTLPALMLQRALDRGDITEIRILGMESWS